MNSKNQNQNTTQQQYVVYGPGGKTIYQQNGVADPRSNKTTTVVYRNPQVPPVQVVQTQYVPTTVVTQQYPAVYQAPTPTVVRQPQQPVVYQNPNQQPALYQQPSYQQAAAYHQTSVYNRTETVEKKRSGLLWLLLAIFLLIVAAVLILSHFLGVFSPRVTNIASPNKLYANGYYLSWDEVHNANGYIVEIDGRTQATDKNGLYLGSLSEGQHTFRVKAIGSNGKGDSSWTPELTHSLNRSLSKPAGIYTFDDVLRWDKVSGAEGYWVYVNGKLYETTSNEFDLSELQLPNGKYKIKVKAKSPNGNAADDSDWQEFYYVVGGEDRDIPQYVRVESGKFLTWDTVDGAIGYEVNIKDKNGHAQKHYVNENRLDISFLEADEDYLFEIRSVFPGDEVFSDWTEKQSFTTGSKVTTPFNISAEDGFLTWTRSLNAKSYIIKIDDVWFGTENNYFPLFSELSPIFKNPKTYDISILAVANTNMAMSDSNWSNVFEYNVIKLDAPSRLRISGGTLKWNAIDEVTEYEIEINGERYYSSSNELDVSTICAEVKMYNIYVKALGNRWNALDSEKSIALNQNVILPDAPKNLRINDKTALLMWDAIPNIKEYKIDINGEEHTSTTNSFSLRIFDIPNIYKIKVMAVGDGEKTLDSVWTSTIFYDLKSTPNTPKDLKVEDGVLTWTGDSSNKKGYAITIDGRQYVTDETSLDLKGLNLPLGEHKIRIQAKGDGMVNLPSTWSDEFIYVVKQLDVPETPVILENTEAGPIFGGTPVGGTPRISSPILQWGEVLNAKYYEVYIDGLIFIANTNKYVLEGYQPGEYAIKVRAVGDGVEFQESDWTLEILYRVYLLEVPQNITVSNVSVSWNKVDNALGYIVKINETVLPETKETHYNLLNLAPGTYTINVKAVGNEVTHFSSDFANANKEFTVEILSTPQGFTITNGVLYWAAVNHAQSYDIYIEDKFEGNTAGVTFDLNHLDVGTHKISVQALGDEGEYRSSLMGETTYEIVRLAEPLGITIDSNGVLLWNGVVNATKYEVTIDGKVVKDITDTKLNLDLPEYKVAKDYPIVIKAIGNGYDIKDSFNSAQIYFVVKTLATPSVSINATTSNVSWQAVSNAKEYRITINGGVAITVTGTEFNLKNNNCSAEGVYKIQVFAIGDNIFNLQSAKSTEATYTVSKVAKPEVTIASAQAKVSWLAVPFATGYRISINGITDTVTSTTYLLGNRDQGTYNITVQAIGDGISKLDSALSDLKVYTVIELSPPTASISGTTLTWTAVSNATTYVVKVNGIDRKTVNAPAISYDLHDLSLPGGSYQVQVYAKSSGENFIDSGVSTVVIFNKEKLAKPTLTVNTNAGKITWNAVQNAQGYRVDVNGTVTTVQAAEFSMTGRGAATYNISVQAIGDNKTKVDSDKSTAIYVVSTLGTPAITITGSMVKWNSVPNAVGYIVKVAGSDKPLTTSTQYDLAQHALAVGSYNIQVKAVGNGTTFLESAFCAVQSFTVTKLANPAGLKVESGILKWTAVTNASGYKITIGGVDRGTVTGTSYDVRGLAVANHNITVTALGNNNGVYRDSNATSLTYVVAYLVTPNRPTITNSTLNWSNVANAVSYKVNIDGTIYTAATPTLDLTKILTLAKTYNIKVQAIGNDINYKDSAWSDVATYTISKLAAPTVTIVATTSVVTWTTVANATKYYIRVNSGTEKLLSGTSYNLYSNGVKGLGNYAVQIRAEGNGTTYLSSDWSAVKTYTVSKLAAPTGLNFTTVGGVTQNNFHLDFTGVAGAISYELYENGVLYKTTTGTRFANVRKSPVGTYNLQIVAVGNSVNYLNSDKSAILPYTNTSPVRMDGCVVGETLVTLADGSTKEIQKLNGTELLLVWNFLTGTFDKAPVQFIKITEANEEKPEDMIYLTFSDTERIEIARIHGLFDSTLNEFVYITAKNYQDYIGHYFNKQIVEPNGKISWRTVQLLDVKTETRVVTVYNPVTFQYLSCYLNGMLTVPADSEGITNIFEVDAKTMQYDMQKYYQDIMEYGLYTYEELKKIVKVPLIGEMPRVMFDALNAQYFKVAVGKGLLDLEKLPELFTHFAASIELHSPIVK